MDGLHSRMGWAEAAKVSVTDLRPSGLEQSLKPNLGSRACDLLGKSTWPLIFFPSLALWIIGLVPNGFLHLVNTVP